MSRLDWQSARRILAVRLDTMGDVLMTSPALRALKGGGRDRHLTLRTSPAGAAAGRLIPEVDEVRSYAAPWQKASPPQRGASADWSMAAMLRREGFDAAVIFTVYSQNPLPAALFCYLADIPLRLAHCRENPYQLLTDWVPEREPEAGVRHEVVRQLDLVATVGCRDAVGKLSLHIPAASRAAIDELLSEQWPDGGGPLVVVHPGASAPSRRYPPEDFAAAARRLRVELGCRIAVTGTTDEMRLVDSVRQVIGGDAVGLAGRLTLAELAGLIDRASLLIANNTGPVHLAAAAGTPVVDLYALTNPQHAPWGVPHRLLFRDVPCRWCYKSVCPEGHHGCLRGVSPEEVVEACRDLLDSSREGCGPEDSRIIPIAGKPIVTLGSP
jgi:lipopolysaccharide heptosyltransferase II